MPKPILRRAGIAQYLALCRAPLAATLPEVIGLVRTHVVQTRHFGNEHILFLEVQHTTGRPKERSYTCGCRESEYYTEDIKHADAVFVHDYCYIQWMIGDMHANERKFPHREVHQGYTALSSLDRSVKAHNTRMDSQSLASVVCRILGSDLGSTRMWIDRFGKLQGRDFVFFEPHPFSGVYSQFCEEFARYN